MARLYAATGDGFARLEKTGEAWTVELSSAGSGAQYLAVDPAGPEPSSSPSGNLTRDHILDNITLYWLTRTGASAARSYWEAYGPDAPAAGRRPLAPPTIPFGAATFPGEIWRTPRSWVEASYPNLI